MIYSFLFWGGGLFSCTLILVKVKVNSPNGFIWSVKLTDWLVYNVFMIFFSIITCSRGRKNNIDKYCNSCTITNTYWNTCISTNNYWNTFISTNTYCNTCISTNTYCNTWTYGNTNCNTWTNCNTYWNNRARCNTFCNTLTHRKNYWVQAFGPDWRCNNWTHRNNNCIFIAVYYNLNILRPTSALQYFLPHFFTSF